MKTNITTITNNTLAQINEDRIANGYDEITTSDIEAMLLNMVTKRPVRDGYGLASNPFCGTDITGAEIANIAYWLWKKYGYTSSVQRPIKEQSLRELADRECGDVLPGNTTVPQNQPKQEWVGEWTYSLDVKSVMILEDAGNKLIAIPTTHEEIVTFARFFEIKDAQHRALSFHENYSRMSDIGRRALFPVTFTIDATYETKSLQFISANAEGKTTKKTWNRAIAYRNGLLNKNEALAFEAFEAMADTKLESEGGEFCSVLYAGINRGRNEGKYAIDALGDYLCHKDFDGIAAMRNAEVIGANSKDANKTATVINDYLLAWCDSSNDSNLFGKINGNNNTRYGAVSQVRLCFALGMMAAVVDAIHADGNAVNRESMKEMVDEISTMMYVDGLRDSSLLCDTARYSVFNVIRKTSKKLRNNHKTTQNTERVVACA